MIFTSNVIGHIEN